ncbi:hypothetical protein [Pseudacidovorax intermedius]|uniref:Single-stranded DNA-binding protein n=1 Tax=Pseudacidovorax intermedius TaxID=433924 RepID=A0A147GSM6_9BURK|nr:hypothetical protein [Pseudacidovorax intermedius]KTT20393.1 hypothetical protein NS331_13935 [Pseudacidovorax intermedius]
MAITALIQIIKVNEKRGGTKDGRAWEMQDAECLLLNEDGTPAQVGVLMLPKQLRGEHEPKPGFYSGAFALGVSLRDRRVEAMLTGLSPLPPNHFQRGQKAS